MNQNSGANIHSMRYVVVPLSLPASSEVCQQVNAWTPAPIESLFFSFFFSHVRS
jgi:hypothetical protein